MLIKHISMWIIIVHMWKKYKAIQSPNKYETLKRKKNIPQISDLWYMPVVPLKPQCAPRYHQLIKKWIPGKNREEENKKVENVRKKKKLLGRC